MISVLILTKNEEANLPHCLDAVKWSDDIVVLDSFSTDRTVDIATAAGARVFQRTFDNERSQREYSLTLPFKHSWVYNPDADEIATEQLRDEMLKAVRDGRHVAYRVRFKTMFMDRWIKHSSLYPTWVMRVFRPECIQFAREVNLTYIANGSVGRLNEHFLHMTFRKGIAAWLDKHNLYSTGEAAESVQSLRNKRIPWGDLFQTSDPVRRRAGLKELSTRVPCRPLLRFLYMYFAKLGILDGVAGYHYCRLLSIYEYMIVLKMRELQRQSLPQHTRLRMVTGAPVITAES
ncbi:MAG: glycosyltransferase family 2 protein [Planctomycetota bacterium]|nr:MAG: glycosyltransferase family 2 protein [Planctomycetota bacterium]